jgi:subtilisin family serine protease
MKNFLNVFFVLLTFSFHSFGQLSVPNDWYFGNPDGTYNGISINKVYAEFLKNKTPKSIIVGVIDSGIDIDHEDLKDNIWINPGEIPANGIDDDKNGMAGTFLVVLTVKMWLRIPMKLQEFLQVSDTNMKMQIQPL